MSIDNIGNTLSSSEKSLAEIRQISEQAKTDIGHVALLERRAEDFVKVTEVCDDPMVVQRISEEFVREVDRNTGEIDTEQIATRLVELAKQRNELDDRSTESSDEEYKEKYESLKEKYDSLTRNIKPDYTVSDPESVAMIQQTEINSLQRMVANLRSEVTKVTLKNTELVEENRAIKDYSETIFSLVDKNIIDPQSTVDTELNSSSPERVKAKLMKFGSTIINSVRRR